MCFWKSKQSKVLRAKRGIKVYKIGAYADEGIFKPFYYQEFEYPVNQIVFTEVKFTDTINWGFHSYINCELVSSYNDVKLYSCGKLILWVSLPTVYLGEFIIPKGATYCLNRYGEVVSDKLMYTGNHIEITSDKIYNSKELWKRKLGEIFTCNGKLYQVVKGFSCNGCTFIKNGNCYLADKLLGPCAYTERTDKTSIIFKEINNMEIKNNQLTIDIPEGMEIDLKNSDLAKGIVKFKKKDITYDDILQECPTNFSGLRVRNHCLDKILAISQLMNIAKYYNKDWEPNWSDPSVYKYFIICAGDIYKVDYNCKSIYNNIYFKNKKDAQAVINNPNFRNILDAIYKN